MKDFTKISGPAEAPRSLLFLFFLTLGTPTFALEIEVRPQKPRPGDTVMVAIFNSIGPEAPVCKFDGADLPVYPMGQGRWKALLGLGGDMTPGPRPLEVENQEGQALKMALTVYPAAFGYESLTFTPEKDRLKNLGRGESKRIRKFLREETPQRLWEGSFLRPIEGEVSTPYGTRRAHSDYHRGVDLRSETGVLIKAPAPGNVILVEEMQMHGNTILIDHGQGIMSIYLHLWKFLVQAGQIVKKGQPIGKVGSTGLSTAPHLHWGVYVHGTPVNPLSWIEKEY